MRQITILPGTDKAGNAEPFDSIALNSGDMLAVVGGTGSGKSRFIKDIEQLVSGDSVTRRRILLDGSEVAIEERINTSTRLIAHLGQNMRFVLDAEVLEFIRIHMDCRGQTGFAPEAVLDLANTMTPEKIHGGQNLTTLSGGQTRALMIADVAMVCQSPVVLVDEIENAGIDKSLALKVLTGSGKIIIVVTHDPHTALLCERRIRIENGAVRQSMNRSRDEEIQLGQLEEQYTLQNNLRDNLRKGVSLI